MVRHSLRAGMGRYALPEKLKGLVGPFNWAGRAQEVIPEGRVGSEALPEG